MKRLFLTLILATIAVASFAQQSLIKAAIPAYWETPSGKYEVAVDESFLAEHTVFYPKDLSDFPSKDRLPVLVMSGPGADKTSSAFRPFFTEVASHGYMMIVSGVLTEETVNTGILPKNKKEDMLAAIDWAIAANGDPNSPFYGKIDTKNIGAMGQSAGGLQALELKDDPRITHLALFNSGMFKADSPMGRRMGSAKPKAEVFADFTKPIAYFVGGTDMARQNAEDDFPYITKAPVVLAVRHIEGDAHAGTFREYNGGAFAEACIDWLDWNMKGKMTSAATFLGENATIKKDPLWIDFQTKNLPNPAAARPARAAQPAGPTDWPEFKRYEDANAAQTAAPLVVLMGDSITDNWAKEDADFFTKNNYVGRGISGQTASQMLVRFRQDVIDLNPKAVAIMAGTNDLCQELASMAYYPERNLLGNIYAMCELAEYHGIKVLLCAITPCESYMPIPDIDAGSKIAELNAKLKAYADSHKNVTWVDYFTPLATEKNGLPDNMTYDGVHPTINCYSLMEDILNESVKKVLKVKTPLYSIPMEKAEEIKAASDRARREKGQPTSHSEMKERMKNFRR